MCVCVPRGEGGGYGGWRLTKLTGGLGGSAGGGAVRGWGWAMGDGLGSLGGRLRRRRATRLMGDRW